jgi:hypothetical protein
MKLYEDDGPANDTRKMAIARHEFELAKERHRRMRVWYVFALPGLMAIYGVQMIFLLLSRSAEVVHDALNRLGTKLTRPLEDSASDIKMWHRRFNQARDLREEEKLAKEIAT